MGRHIAVMTPLTDRTGRFSALKTLTLAGLVAPAAYLVYRYWSFDLGPLPAKEALLVTGLWAIRFLVATLALTPAQRMFNWPKLALIRRMAGIGAFAYASLHFSLYIVNSNYDLGLVASEIIHRVYLTIGFAALVGLSLLAATSTDRAVRALGKRWKQLHRIVHGIAALGLLHFFLQSKIDVSEATLMAGLFLTLMIYRIAIRRRIGLSAPVLAASAMAGGIATALAEFAWYGLATGVDPWRIAMANLMVEYGPRPAVLVLLTGLAIATAALARSQWSKLPARTRFSPA
jgi:methionine sulfoxide reductase heme-binding subunit